MADPKELIERRIRTLQAELEEKYEAGRKKFHYRLDRGKVVFDEEVLARHRDLKVRLRTYFRGARLGTVITAPVIYGMILPLGLLDIFLFIYQQTCFRAYGIGRVDRREFIVFDRHRLQYLNGVERLNCVYCSYANGLLAYAVEIASRTEQYWCPIKHAERVRDPHRRYADFVAYGDAENYRRKLQDLRRALHEETD